VSEPETPLQAAQQRLVKAAMQQRMDPIQAGLSAYINSMLQSVRLSALIEVYLAPQNATWTAQEALDAAILRNLTQLATDLENRASAIHVAQGVPEIVRTQ
jgi:hypothetical protein